MKSKSRRGLVVGAAFMLCACGQATNATSAKTTIDARPISYVAIGGSDAIGAGSTDPLLSAWPQLFYRNSLPRSTVFVNLAEPHSTIAQALIDQLPEALSIHPSVVTIWLNTTDLFDGVPSATYAVQLNRLISSLRNNGATTVLVANSRPLDQLPAYRACLGGGPSTSSEVTCPSPVPSPATLDANVAAYDAVTASEVSKLGAIPVDLHGDFVAAQLRGTQPSLVSTDGFGLSDAGQARVAQLFATALAASHQKLRPLGGS